MRINELCGMTPSLSSDLWERVRTELEQLGEVVRVDTYYYVNTLTSSLILCYTFIYSYS